MAARGLVKQAFLRKFYRQIAAPAKLLDVLEAANDAAATLVAGGRLLTESRGNEFTAVYSVLAGFTPEAAIELTAELLNVYEDAINELSGEGVSTPTDLQIRDRMLPLLAPVRERFNDYSQMGFSGDALLEENL